MFRGLTPFIREDAVISLFDLLEEYAYRVVEVYLKDNAWNDEAKRLRDSRFIGVGTYRLLTNIAIEYQNSSPEELIAFYERCKRPKDDPHYEDLIVTVLMGVVVGILANFCYDVLKGKVHGIQDSKELANRLWNVFGRGLNYLLRARWARDMLWRKQISKDDHAILLMQLRAEYLGHMTQVKLEVDVNYLLKVEPELEAIARTHGVELADLPQSLIVKLIELTSKSIELDDILEKFNGLLEGHGGHHGDG